MRHEEFLEKIRFLTCAVLGFGVSNRPLVRFLMELGAKSITVHDKKSVEELGGEAEALASEGVGFVTGESYLDAIDADVIFRSPGIRADKGGIPEALARGAFLTSEMELFFAMTPARIIAVTGSDGKTTTTTLISKILAASLAKSGEGRVYVGGNIGEPLLPYVREMTAKDFAVVELSSFQLMTMKQSPWRAVITNLSPNHLDWHTDMEEYIEAKRNICSHSEITLLVTNAENDVTARLAAEQEGCVTLFSSKTDDKERLTEGDPKRHAIYEKDGKICFFDGKDEREILKTADIRLLGRHNVENYMAAIAVLEGLADAESIREIATSFGGVEHRLEFVRELDGVRYINSSIDSSPSRTAAALSALTEKPIVLCGGYDKHIPFEPLGVALCERAKAVVLTGATAPKIADAIANTGMDAPPVYLESDFGEAVYRCRALAASGDIVLLSPACASFDAFENFMARGKYFKKIVTEME
ncbi:MAG: UDP-N-acetylmuramoyl-L-alanine--D-glutamate ligase [Ruminococcaceae bacterium]|nr:UDP-N-acetylmuramoyl-L-alanine--D-glutamate ligase [Oscillospiraceae bacterium]